MRMAVWALGLSLVIVPPAMGATGTECPPHFLLSWGSQGSQPGEFDHPWYIDVDVLDRVWVGEEVNHRVQRFDTNGGPDTLWYVHQPVATAGVYGVQVDATGEYVYITTGCCMSGSSDSVWMYTDEGVYLAGAGGCCCLPGGLRNPEGVALDGAGNVYVVSGASENRIQKYDGVLSYLTCAGGSCGSCAAGSGPSELSWPRGIAITAGGVMYVADSDNNRVVKLLTDGTFVIQWGVMGSGPGEFLRPFDVAVGSDGGVYVTDEGNNRVQKFDANGTFLACWGSGGSGPGQFNSPRGIDLDAAGNIYVVDHGNHRVQKFGYGPTPAPVICPVTDVGNDQGKQARVRWLRSLYDAPGDGVDVTEYEVFRRQDMFRLDGWDLVGREAAHGDSFYQMVVPTLCDSTSEGTCWSVFMVRATTTDPFLTYSSIPDSGYSVDNLAPAPPANLMLAGEMLSWDESPEPDFDYYSIYGSESPNLNGSETPLGNTSLPEFSVQGQQHSYYLVTATDFAGNEGGAASVSNPVAAPTPSVHAAFQLSIRPNPFNPRTDVRFRLASPEEAKIEVFDVQGRIVRRVTTQAVAGWNSWTWNGEDDGGRAVSSGRYLVRLSADGREESTSVTLLR